MFDQSASMALLKAVPCSLIDLPLELAALAASVPTTDVDLQPEGMWPLRVAIADHVTGQGVPTTGEQVLVTNGTQHACSLAAAGPADCSEVSVTSLTEPPHRPGPELAPVGDRPTALVRQGEESVPSASMASSAR